MKSHFRTLPTQLRSVLERDAEMLQRQDSCRGESMVTHRRDKRRVRLAYHAAKFSCARDAGGQRLPRKHETLGTCALAFLMVVVSDTEGWQHLNLTVL